MNYDLKDEEQAKAYLERVGVEYRFQCFHEKSPEGCHRLADYFESVKKEHERAAKMYKSTCDDYHYGHSCYKYGNYRTVGQGCEKDLTEAIKYEAKGCDYDYIPACFQAGILSLSKGHQNIPNAVTYLTKACSNNHPLACFNLSALYMRDQTELKKDMKKAFDLALKGCELGHLYSCVNLSIMYRRGDGVDQNSELADKYKKKAQSMRDELVKSEQTIRMNE
ncbi:cytochrome c oxidase assembly factor 7 homolog [Octopus vulgaris]|uniref:Cytochrome c oxidase assembly factor 7 homolog n=2 Tax=Octopus TaxID=6643 RepID=A0AA36FA81_OCTVU|nr:cytochrome c oxidase assembly factor 7 homolog [Octopus sinensis]CAI9731571.1 cytochrome c oxidase assembly factor 7 homolog [Octopus vulgaris]